MFKSVKSLLGFDKRDSNNKQEKNAAVEIVPQQEDIRRNNNLNIGAVNNLIKDLRENIGEACVASSIISYDQGASIASYNFDEKTAALVGKYTVFLQDMVVESGLGKSCSYYAVNLPGNMMSFHLIFNKYCWTTFVDISQVPLGMIMNGVLPECVENFQLVME